MLRGLLVFLWLWPAIAVAQDGWSKHQLLKQAAEKNEDTTLIDIYNELCWPVYSYDLHDSSLYYGFKAMRLASQIRDFKRLCVAYRRLGITYANTGDVKNAIRNQERSFEIADSLHWTRAKYLALNNVGVAYLNHELLNKALDYFLRSLVYLERTDDHADLSRVYSNCGVIYRRIKNIPKAREFFSWSKREADLSADPDLQVNADCNLSTVYRIEGRMDSALFMLAEARMALAKSDQPGSRFVYYLSEALYFMANGQHASCLKSLSEASRNAQLTGDKVTVLINYAEMYEGTHDEGKTAEYYLRAYELCRGQKMYDNMELITRRLSALYEKAGNLSDHARFLKYYVAYRDSNEAENKSQEILSRQLEFDYERKHVADSVRFQQRDRLRNMELEVAEARIQKGKTFRIFLFGVLVMIMAFTAFTLNRLQLTRRQKKTIEEQKQIVELKNREIMDSISYGRRLQEAILTQISVLRRSLNVDIFYQPKELIGGDFYFYEEYEGRRFFAVCDCTGHGIPGAIMSVVCQQALQKSIREFGLTDPAMILETTRDILTGILRASEQNIRDGMDCSLIVLEAETASIRWSGAFNPLWIIEQNQLREFKPDKHSVSYYEQQKPFSSHQIPLQKGSLVYLFTDGYADQFGGDRGKKYKYKTLKAFLLGIQHKEVHLQVEALRQNFYAWRGGLDQVDDVTIAVIRV